MVGFTLYDIIRFISDVSEELRQETQQGCRGGSLLRRKNSAKDTTRQLTTIAIKQSDSVMDCMGSILNGEFPDLAGSHYFRARSRSPKREEPVIDHRVYQKIINKTTIRGATAFIRSPTDGYSINTLHRAQYFATTSGFKGLPSENLDALVITAIAARKERSKMLLVFDSDQ